MEGLKTSPTRPGVPAQRSTNTSSARPLPQEGHWYYITRLVAFFCAWKLLLLAVVCGSPGSGYDTSTSILFSHLGGNSGSASTHSPSSLSATVVEHVVLRLTRWDALYFISASQRGLVYEQEWAFSWALSRLTSMLSDVLPASLPLSSLVRHALTGILVSHLAHLGAVLACYHFVGALLPSSFSRKQHVAFTTACLHVLSPAGVFLSAPYAEAPFAFTTFLGLYAHTLSLKHPCYQVLSLPAAGVAFAGAAMLRSNGLLNGIPLALDFFWTLWSLFVTTAPPRNNSKRVQRPATKSLILRLPALATAGLTTLAGFILPQYVAYKTYCTTATPRPWCTNLPPSIYTFVQKEYWGVGFLHYWTLSNLPLFLLAAPTLILLVSTGVALLRDAGAVFHGEEVNGAPGGHGEGKGEGMKAMGSASAEAEGRGHSAWTLVVMGLGLQQCVLAGLALTSFHVQVVNRLSSGLAGWYLVLALLLHDRRDSGAAGGLLGGGVLGRGVLGRVKVHWVVRGMVCYAIVQGALYGAFLPPA